jgi:hypothetical protein
MLKASAACASWTEGECLAYREPDEALGLAQQKRRIKQLQKLLLPR